MKPEPVPNAAASPTSEPSVAELRLGRDLLIRICWIVIIGMVVIGSLMAMTGVFHQSRFVGQLLLATLAAIGLLLARAGRLQASAAFMAWGMTGVITYYCAVTGGPVTSSTLGYFIVIAGAGWYLGRTTTIALAAVTVLALCGLAIAQTYGWLPKPSPISPLFQWLSLVVIFCIGTLLVVAASRAMAMRLWDLDRARADLSAALEDISARESQLRLVVNNVPAMIFYCGKDQRCRWANAAAAHFMGQTPASIIDRHVRDIVGEQVYQRIGHQIEKVLTGEHVAYESTRPGPDGEHRDLEVELVPDLNEEGRARGWFGLMRDVTERRRREQLFPSLVKGTARATGDAFFRSMVSQIGQSLGVSYVLVAETTDNGEKARSLAFWSTSGFLPDVYYDLAGAPCKLVVENGSAHFPHGVATMFPEDRPLTVRGIEGYCGLSMLGAEEQTIGLLVVMHTAPLQLTAEQMATLEIFASRAGAELERLRLENSLRDSNAMLERRVQERTVQLSEAIEELEAFSYSVSHDLRAPLRHIGGYTRLLAEDQAGALGADGHDYVERILRSVQRLDELITDLLELSKVNRVELELKKVDLSAMAIAIAEEIEHAQPGHKATWLIAGGLQAECDQRLLSVLLTNLIGNAWKYSGKKAAPRIEVGFEDGAYFVRDNGAGFDMQHAGKLFQPFQRLHKPSEFEGVGIGLATVARIVKRHGGRIWAEAVPDQGATFRFTLPSPGVH